MKSLLIIVAIALMTTQAFAQQGRDKSRETREKIDRDMARERSDRDRSADKEPHDRTSTSSNPSGERSTPMPAPTPGMAATSDPSTPTENLAGFMIPRPNPALSAMLFAQSEIQVRQPTLTTDMLQQDQEALRASYPAIALSYKRKNHSSQDAFTALLTAWQYLRTEKLKPTEMLAPQTLITLADTLGIIIIKSTPDDATIIVGNKPLAKNVNTVYCSPGTHRIQLSKPGYVTLEETIDIKANEETEFVRELKKQ
ncbi:MAG: hypothetical protein QOF02_1301 [Blastocatellia bacterium]|jgi:Ni/Co efflux regulator RcnB|nr:hypothetical protein [Blastocatellia bacterium]